MGEDIYPAEHVYATLDQFEQSPFSEDDEQDAIVVTDKGLARASMKIDELLLNARFDRDPATDLPSDPRIISALMKATCAQAAWNAQTGNTSGAAGFAAPLSLGPLSVGGKNATATATAAARTSPEAVQILRTAGLLPDSPDHG